MFSCGGQTVQEMIKKALKYEWKIPFNSIN